MRATEGNRRVRTWRKLGGFIAAAVMALSVIGGGTALAATPSWSMTVTPLPAKVTAGEDAGYAIQIFNTGKSNISQAFLTEAPKTTDGTVSAFPINPGDPLSTIFAPLPTTFISTNQGTCNDVGSPLQCTFGAIRARSSVTVIVAFSTGAFDHLTRIFEVNTTGVAGDNNNASHGDVLQGVGTTQTGTGDDFAGTFLVDSAAFVADSLDLSSTNEQSTKVNVPTGTHGISVADGDDASPINCPVATPCWSQTSEIHVNGGASVSSGFSVEIGIYKDLTQTVHGVYHEFDSPINGVPGENLPKCPKHGAPSQCFTSANAGGGNVLITVYLTRNGKIGAF